MPPYERKPIDEDESYVEEARKRSLGRSRLQGKKLAGSSAIATGGADELSADDEEMAKRFHLAHEDRVRELEMKHQHTMELERAREMARIREENRAEARRYGPLIAGEVTVKNVNGKMVASSVGWRNPNPRAGFGVYFDPGGPGRQYGGGAPAVRGTGIIDNSTGKEIFGWIVSKGGKFTPKYSDGTVGKAVTAEDFGDASNIRGTGRLGIPAFSTETRDAFLKYNLDGAKEGDAGYERAMARAQSMWDAYVRDAVKVFQGVGASLAKESERAGIPDRVASAVRDPSIYGQPTFDRVSGNVSDSRFSPVGSGSRDGQSFWTSGGSGGGPGRIGGDPRSMYGQPGRIGIAPRDASGRSSLSPSWGGASSGRPSQKKERFWGP